MDFMELLSVDYDTDLTPLLCSGETPPGVLHPAVEPSAQERHGPVGEGPEKGDKNDQRAGTPLLGGKTDRVGGCSAWRREGFRKTLLQPFGT